MWFRVHLVDVWHNAVFQHPVKVKVKVKSRQGNIINKGLFNILRPNGTLIVSYDLSE